MRPSENRLNPSGTWPAEAIAVLERAWGYHGGLPRWRDLRRISLVPTRLEGLLPRLKGLGQTFSLPAKIEVRPHERVTVFHEYPGAGRRGVFTNGDVRIESVPDGRVLEESADHRRTFRGVSRYRRWSPLDALYFFGYALWHYHAVPFTLGEAQFLRLRRAGRRGDPLDALEVRLPEDVPTHSSLQTFYFDREGCLKRHDYVADIVGSWARGAHFWRDYQRIEGLLVAAERHVVPRALDGRLPLTVLHATFTRITVELGSIDGR